MSVQLQVRLPFETLRTLVWQLPPAEKQRLRHDLEAEAANELRLRKRQALSRHQQKAARPGRFAPKDERYCQTMAPEIEALTTELGPLAAAAVEAYEVFLENET